MRTAIIDRVHARATPETHGLVAPGFEEVRREFERNFCERGELGAAVAVYRRGDKVVDLWGGRRSPASDDAWQRDTMTVLMSVTKGLAAMTCAVAVARGWLDVDARVARYWPEFAQNGKQDITVRQLLAHEAGLPFLDEPLSMALIDDLDFVAETLARQKPAWPPGTRHGYHTHTLGLYLQEILRRVDPEHRSLGNIFHEEIVEPLELDLYIGLPGEVADERLATVRPLSIPRALVGLRKTPWAVWKKLLRLRSPLLRSFGVFDRIDFNDRRCLEVELPSSNAVGTARSLARAYACFAEGGRELGIGAEQFAELCKPPAPAVAVDEVLGLPSYFSLGFLRPGPVPMFGSSPRAFGAPGAGGSLAFADPDARLGYAYVMNKLDFYLFDDPREKALRDAVYRAVRKGA
jgi:CubicO group peptidase (beta-lactamase class C family)